MEESQGEAAQTHFPEQMRKYCQNHGEDKGLHERMAELLRNSRHEKESGKSEWMAIPKDTDVYLETMETAQNQKEETYRSGGGQPLCGNDSL